MIKMPLTNALIANCEEWTSVFANTCANPSAGNNVNSINCQKDGCKKPCYIYTNNISSRRFCVNNQQPLQWRIATLSLQR
eukprot:Pgem_evm1s433